MNNPPPPNILARMSPADRAKLGKAGRTTAEIDAANEIKAEKDLHALICNYLRLADREFIHARMDRKSPLPEGWPDFTILCPGGRVCLIEVKAPGGKLHPAQAVRHHKILFSGGNVYVVRSFQEFHDTLELYL